MSREKFHAAFAACCATSASPHTINSGARCVAHNAAVGGEPRSKHVTGEALDIQPAGGRKLEVVTQLFWQPATVRVCVYGWKGHVHVQLDHEYSLLHQQAKGDSWRKIL